MRKVAFRLVFLGCIHSPFSSQHLFVDFLATLLFAPRTCIGFTVSMDGKCITRPQLHFFTTTLKVLPIPTHASALTAETRLLCSKPRVTLISPKKPNHNYSLSQFQPKSTTKTPLPASTIFFPRSRSLFSPALVQQSWNQNLWGSKPSTLYPYHIFTPSPQRTHPN